MTAVPSLQAAVPPRGAPAAPAARHQPPVLSVPCGAGLLPAGLAGRWQAAAPAGGILVVSAAQGCIPDGTVAK